LPKQMRVRLFVRRSAQQPILDTGDAVTEEKNTIDLWTLGTLPLWLLIFMMGLFPENVFAVLREMGYVVTMRAIVNSHWFITMACATYLGWFTFNRCMECNHRADVAFGKSVQVVILGITAFLPLRLEQLGMYFSIPDPFLRGLILSVVAVKCLAWLFLLHLLLRYYLLSGHRVFKNMPLLFPSALFLADEQGEDAGDKENTDV
jgi:hypothetical protein